MRRTQELPIQERFERSLKTGGVVRFYDEIYIVGDYGFFPVARLYGGNVAALTLRGHPFNSTNSGGEIAAKLIAAGYPIQSKSAEPAV